MGVIGVMVGLVILLGMIITNMILQDVISPNGEVSGVMTPNMIISPISPELPANMIVYALIITPITFAIVGMITGAITALLYNLIAKISKGIKMEIEEIE